MLSPTPFRLQLDPPVGDLAILAVVDPTAMGCIVVVDSTVGDPLEDLGGANPLKWQMRLSNNIYEGSSVAKIAFNEIGLQFTPVGFSFGANFIRYLNAPSDVSTVAGRVLPAINNFPF